MIDTDALLANAKPEKWTDDCWAWKPQNRGHMAYGGLPDAVFVLLEGAVKPWHGCDGSCMYRTEAAALHALLIAVNKYKESQS